MLQGNFVLKTSSFSRLFVPRDRYPLRRYYSVIPISEIPDAWAGWLDVNARDSTSKGRVPQSIRKTLIDCPEWFAEYNRGLTVVADKVEWNNTTNELTLVFRERAFHGILDGGHTLNAILDQRFADDEEGQVGYCNIEIFTGLEQDDIPSVVESRNTSKQVASKSLLNLDRRFEDLKDAIGNEKSSLISWKENEEGALDVREFIGMLTALDAESYPVSGNTHPLLAYSGKEACLKRFSTSHQVYRKLLDIAPDVLEMWDEIQYCLPTQYNKKGPEASGAGTGGKFGRLTGVKLLPKKRKLLPFIEKEIDYDIPTGYLYPVLAAFRAMLEDKSGYWRWGKGLNPQELIRNGLAADIFIGSVRNSIDAHRNANRTGKDTQAWTAAFQAARIFYLEQ